MQSLRYFLLALLLTLTLCCQSRISTAATTPQRNASTSVATKPTISERESATASAAAEAPAAPIVLPVLNLQSLIAPLNANKEVGDTPAEPSFGTHLLDWLSVNGLALSNSFSASMKLTSQAALLETWWAQQISVPRFLERWQLVAEFGALMLLWGLGGAIALHILLTPVRIFLQPKSPVRFWQRFGWAIVRFIVGLIPVIFCLVVCLAILGGLDEGAVRVKLILQGGLYALILGRLILLAGRFVLAPATPTVRLAPLTTARAAHLFRWWRGLTVFVISSNWLLDVARIVEIPAETQRSVTQLFGLFIVLSLLILVQRNRLPVAHWLRGTADAYQGNLWTWARFNLSRQWHRLATLYLLIGYLVTVLSPSGSGFTALLRGTLVTVTVFLGMNVLLYGLGQLAKRAEAAEARQERLPLHQAALRGLLRVLVIAGSFYLILLGWNVDFSAWLQTDLAQRLLGAATSISFAILGAVIIYEIICSVLNTGQQTQDGGLPTGINRVARIQTLLPLIQHGSAVILTVLVILIGLSELGINIAPLLAGAGIVGVAVGFGSQALVKDFITGLFIILEDTIHVGDVIKCDAHEGVVESMTIRTLRLRDIHGALHVLPYSVVTGFINRTRSFAYAVIDIGVAYHSDLRHCFDVLRAIGATLQSDPELGQNILTALEIDGVQSFADSSIMIRARVRTLPGQQWKVKQEFMLRMKDAFDKANITIPFPTVQYQFPAAAEAPLPHDVAATALPAATIIVPPKSEV